MLDGEADIFRFGAPVWERYFNCIDVGMFTNFDLISLCFFEKLWVFYSNSCQFEVQFL